MRKVKTIQTEKDFYFCDKCGAEIGTFSTFSIGLTFHDVHVINMHTNNVQSYDFTRAACQDCKVEILKMFNLESVPNYLSLEVKNVRD